jgi:hypothetical protein
MRFLPVRLAVLFIAGFSITGPGLAQAPAVTIGDAIRLTEEGSGWAEVTSVVVPPGRNPACPDGRLLISASYNTISAKLDGSDRKIWRLPKATSDPKLHGETAQPWVIHDQHMVLLRDGSVLQSIEAVTWNDNLKPRPSWWNWTKDFVLKTHNIPGGRGTIYMYRSADCGGSWTLVGEVDAGRLPVKEFRGIPGKDEPTAKRGPFLRALAARQPTPGLCGTPRRFSKSGNRVNFSESGGWDGHYLYSDPSTGVLILTTPCAYGSGEIDKQLSQTLWLVSRDNGATWTVTRQTDQFGQFRMPVTSDGAGGVVTLYGVGGEGGPSFRLQRISGEYAAHTWLDYRDGPIISVQSGDKRSAEQKAAAQVETHVLTSPILAPARPPGGGAKVGVWSWDNNGTVLATHIYRANANGTNIRRIDTIRAVEPTGDVIEPAFVDGPLVRPIDLLYWIERIPRRSEPNHFRIRYQLYAGDAPVLAQPGTLTLASGQPYTWGWKKVFVGEYMSGASYIGPDGTLHFVASWVQNGGLYINAVGLSLQTQQAALAGRKLGIQVLSRKL